MMLDVCFYMFLLVSSLKILAPQLGHNYPTRECYRDCIQLKPKHLIDTEIPTTSTHTL